MNHKGSVTTTYITHATRRSSPHHSRPHSSETKNPNYKKSTQKTISTWESEPVSPAHRKRPECGQVGEICRRYPEENQHIIIQHRNLDIPFHSLQLLGRKLGIFRHPRQHQNIPSTKRKSRCQTEFFHLLHSWWGWCMLRVSWRWIIVIFLGDIWDETEFFAIAFSDGSGRGWKMRSQVLIEGFTLVIEEVVEECGDCGDWDHSFHGWWDAGWVYLRH